MRLSRALLSCALAFTLACNEGPTSDVLGPQAAISDAVHGLDGNEHFFWLPPMVKNPGEFNGTFDGSLSPAVEVCDWDGIACTSTLATFTLTSGPDGETVELFLIDEFYRAQWHTKDSSLEPGKTYRIAVSESGQELGFADVAVVGTGNELKDVNRDESIPLLDNAKRTLQIRFRIEEGAVCNTLVAYYPMDGNALDASGNQNNGTVNGAVLFPDRKGTANSAYRFDGSTNITVGGFTLPASSEGLTVAYWFNAETTAGQRRVIDHDWYPLNLPVGSFVTDVSFALARGIVDTTEPDDRTGPDKFQTRAYEVGTVSANVWYHFAITYDGAEGSGYLNGNLTDSFTDTRPFRPSSATLYIGAHPPWGFVGRLDEVRIYGCALTTGQIQALAQ